MLTNLSRKNEILENVSLKDYVTMKIGGIGKKLVQIDNEDELLYFYQLAQKTGEKIFPLGGGSNTIFSDQQHDLLIFLMRNRGILKTYENSEIVNLEVQAGEDWDEFVRWTVENGFCGLESLSGIPGTVGAGPIQNIGAYGSEIKDTLIKVRILDLKSGEIIEVLNNECRFSYRNSVFKENLGQFIIISASFSLTKTTNKISIPQYKDVQLYFLSKMKKFVAPHEIREAILEIRNQKIPDPALVPNSGSFFKNPVIKNEVAAKIGLKYPEMPYSKIDHENSKIYAGWLIEKAGLKNLNFGQIKIDAKNALIITNPGADANFKELVRATNQIIETIKSKFDLELEIEPNIIG